MESDVSNAGFLYGAWEEGFHPIISTIKTKQALSLICLKLHFELAKNVCFSKEYTCNICAALSFFVIQ